MFSDHFDPAPTKETGYPGIDNGMYRAYLSIYGLLRNENIASILS